ncbi:MAG: nucleotidyltransferase domain-containing protein [Candidatus Jordarchaeaceae archaeon]
MPSFVVEESLNSVKVFWLDQDNLIRTIQRLAVKVGTENKNVVKIVLFGSLAERRAVPGSDADILIILEGDDRKFMDRIEEWVEKFQIDFPVEVFPYTLEELEVPLVRGALSKGIILYEKGTQSKS